MEKQSIQICFRGGGGGTKHHTKNPKQKPNQKPKQEAIRAFYILDVQFSVLFKNITYFNLWTYLLLLLGYFNLSSTLKMKVIWTWKLFITIAYYVIFDIPVEPGSTSDTCWLQIWMESRCTPASPCTVRERERRWKQYSSHSGYHWSFLDFSAPTISVFSIPVFILKIEKWLALTFWRLISSEELSLTTSRTSSNSLIEMPHVCFLWTSYWHFLNAPIFLQNGITELASFSQTKEHCQCFWCALCRNRWNGFPHSM